jgi:membrane associated rhomboid family serine protease
MSEPLGMSTMQFPRPGPALRAVLWVVASLAVFGAAWVHWVPNGEAHFVFFTLDLDRFLHHGQFWRLFTAGLLSPPGGPGSIQHLLFMLMGLYFLSPDLERRWGGQRYVFFLFGSVIAGFVLTLLADLLPIEGHLLHPRLVFGTGAAITGLAVAWARENAHREIRLFFVLPVKGQAFLWLTIGFCVLAVVMGDESSEGVVAPFGGVLAGYFFGGSPSPVRALYLQWKLASLRKRTGGLSAAAMLDPKVVRRRTGGPPLRVVQGGLDDPPSKKDPPRDKRYLN